jgi:hypothetical protein
MSQALEVFWRKRVGVECNHTRRSKDLADIPRNPYEAQGMLGNGYRSPIVPSFAASLLSLPISTDSRTNASATEFQPTGTDGEPTLDQDFIGS